VGEYACDPTEFDLADLISAQADRGTDLTLG